MPIRKPAGIWAVVVAGVLVLGCGKAAQGQSQGELGRCAARVEPLSEADRAMLVQAFREQYGQAWRVEEVARFAAHVVRARLPVGRDDLGDSVELSREQAVARAIDFVAEGARLFGLTPQEAAVLQTVNAWRVPDAPVLQWVIGLSGTAPTPGYEELWPQAGNVFYLNIDIARDGRVIMVVNRSGIAPAFDICTDPRLDPGDPRVVRQVLGTELYYSDISGERRFAGTVAQEHVVAIERDLYFDRTEPGWLAVHLAYRVDVVIDLMTWSFYVDPDSGEILHIEQTFWT